MTAMQQIEFISVEARKLGMKYGEYVEKFGHTLPKPKTTPKQESTDSGRKKPKPSEKICEVCGKPFHGHGSAKYCPFCVLEGKRLKEKERRDKKKGETVDPQARKFANCAICGAVIVKSRPNHKYCNSCKEEKERADKKDTRC